ncbi:MAG: AAA family ATPase [bacterium]
MSIIKNIVKIKNCPSFIDFKPATDFPGFSKYNLFYGWNGSGKTSFSRVLKSFELGENFFDNPEKPAEFEFKLHNGTSISHSNLSDFKDIRVFNKDFIDNTVFCDNSPKFIFFLGKESKEDKEKITQAEIDLEDFKKDSTTKKKLFNKVEDKKRDALTNKAREIRNALTTPREDNYGNYDKLKLENSIANNSEKLKVPEGLKLSYERIVEIKKSILQTSKDPINNLILPNFDILNLEKEISDILTKTVISKVIEELKKDEIINKWVEKGLEIHNAKNLDICAFCNQKIPPNRINDLENHFNDEYQKMLSTVQDLKNTCNFRKVRLDFPDSLGFYGDLATEYVSERKKAENAIIEFNKILDYLISILNQKEQNLFLQSTLNKSVPVDITPFLKINKIIEQHNQKTYNFESKINTDKKDLELHYIAEFMQAYNKILTELDSSQKDYLAFFPKIEGQEERIKELKKNLLNYLIPAQEINRDLEQFLGRNDIQLEEITGEAGYKITRNGNIAENLSEGERTALAIVYFLTKINEDGFNLKNSTIVIDDPVSSLDSNAIFQAFSFIKTAIKDAGQIFILTHHFDFFRQIKNWFQHLEKEGQEVEYFMTVCPVKSDIRKSNILKMDKLLIDYESEYHFLFSVLYKFSKEAQYKLEELYPIPNIARKFLESFLAFRVPLNLDNTYEKLKHIDFDSKKKERIINFVATYSHAKYESGVQDFDMTILGETPAIVDDLLKLVEKEDKKHYDFLLKSIGSLI